MASYISAYDTEAVYPWWDDGFQGFDYSPPRIRQFLEGVRAVASVHLERAAPATFFLVARMLDEAGPDLIRILDDPLFEVESHSYTHPNLIALDLRGDEDALRYELVASKQRIEDAFGRPVTGLTAPGGYPRGFTGRPRILEIMWEAGYRYIRSVGAGPGGNMPAPLHPPFWYAAEGYPEMLETPSHGWHDNILTGQPGAAHWPPLLPWPYPETMPCDARGVYAAYAPGIEYCVSQDLLYYLPIFHPWSIHRIDSGAAQIGMLLDHARGQMDLISCGQLRRMIAGRRELASLDWRPS